jgi:1-carboxybiuret hydrolase subunit AtzG-like protein
MKRKTVRKSPPADRRDAIDSLVVANAEVLGLTLDPSWVANVKFNLQLILRHAALVDEFTLPDDAEPAEIFHA